MNGEVLALNQVADPAFATESMGKGLAIKPSTGELFAPIDGKVGVIFPTKHVVVIETETGGEIMMHIGFNTVDLQGQGFEAVVKEGQLVKAGDLLIKFNKAEIEGKGYETTTAIVVANSDDFSAVNAIAKAGDTVAKGAEFLEVKA